MHIHWQKKIAAHHSRNRHQNPSIHHKYASRTLITSYTIWSHMEMLRGPSSLYICGYVHAMWGEFSLKERKSSRFVLRPLRWALRFTTYICKLTYIVYTFLCRISHWSSFCPKQIREFTSHIFRKMLLKLPSTYKRNWSADINIILTYTLSHNHQLQHKSNIYIYIF